MHSIDDQHNLWLINVLIVVVIIYTIYYSIYYILIESWECSSMKSRYGTPNGNINNIDSSFVNGLRDYYVKTAYNCCSGGSYRNDYVNLCNLEAVIKQGVRCLDFEIYSVNDQPVVSTSTSNSKCIKETFNSVPFSDVMQVLSHNAFGSRQNCPNPTDPLIVHLRVKSDNVTMFDNFAKIFENYNSILLGKSYSFESNGKNLGETPLANLKGKIIIIVDRTNNAFLESKTFKEYVNLTSNSIFMRSLHYHDIKYSPDMTELTNFNRQFMTIGMPDKGSSPNNPSGLILRETGCQFLGMAYQRPDSFLQETNDFFDRSGYAFVIKPPRLRYVPITIKKPPTQSKAMSYAIKKIDGGFYNISI